MELDPTYEQDLFICSESKFPAFVGGYGSGKTEALINRSILGKLENPTTDRAFYEPTYDLVRMIAFPRFEEKLSQLNIPYRLIKSPQNEIHIEGAGKIVFRSMDIPHRIIGYEVADSDVDELDTLKPDDARDVWNRIIARNRQKKAKGINSVGVATTPEGFRFVYQRWVENKQPGYEIIKAPTKSNPHLPEDYIQNLLDAYPPQLIKAYLEGEFVNLNQGTIYHNYDRELSRSKEELRFKDGAIEPLFVGMDFNVGHMAAIVHVKRGDEFHAVAEVIDAYDTPDMVKQLTSRFWPNGKTCEIYVYPDASGDSRKSVNAQVTDLKILRDGGFHIRAPKKNPPVKDRINSVNAVLLNSKGIRRYFVNDSLCPVLVKCLEQQCWNDKGEPDKTTGLDHPVDAIGYFIHHEAPINKPAFTLDLKRVL